MSRRILFFINPISGGKNKIDLEKNLKLKCYWRNSCVDSVILEDSVAGREFIIRILSRCKSHIISLTQGHMKRLYVCIFIFDCLLPADIEESRR